MEPLNRAALQIANEVAADVPEGYEPNLVAGNISNSNIWNPNDPKRQLEVREMFSEMVGWAVDAVCRHHTVGPSQLLWIHYTVTAMKSGNSRKMLGPTISVTWEYAVAPHLFTSGR